MQFELSISSSIDINFLLYSGSAPENALQFLGGTNNIYHINFLLYSGSAPIEIDDMTQLFQLPNAGPSFM